MPKTPPFVVTAVQCRVGEGELQLTLFVPSGAEPMRFAFTIPTPSLALALMSQLEAGVHRLQEQAGPVLDASVEILPEGGA